MARAAAVLVALAAATSVATAIERAVIAETIVRAVDSLPGRPHPDPARHDRVMEALIRVIAGSSERDQRVVRRCFRVPHHDQPGGKRGDHSAERPTSRRTLCQHPDRSVKSIVVHDDPLPYRGHLPGIIDSPQAITSRLLASVVQNVTLRPPSTPSTCP